MLCVHACSFPAAQGYTAGAVQVSSNTSRATLLACPRPHLPQQSAPLPLAQIRSLRPCTWAAMEKIKQAEETKEKTYQVRAIY